MIENYVGKKYFQKTPSKIIFFLSQNMQSNLLWMKKVIVHPNAAVFFPSLVKPSCVLLRMIEFSPIKATPTGFSNPNSKSRPLNLSILVSCLLTVRSQSQWRLPFTSYFNQSICFPTDNL